MPEYLTPGVYLEETSFRSKSIEGVATSTFGMAGLTRYGPTPYDITAPGSDPMAMTPQPTLVTSYTEFERAFGGLDGVGLATDQRNYLAFAARAFFGNGGRRLYVSRVFPFALDANEAIDLTKNFATLPIPVPPDGPPPVPPAGAPAATWRTRWPGAAGNEFNIRVSLQRSKNVLIGSTAGAAPPGATPKPGVLQGLGSDAVVEMYAGDAKIPPGTDPKSGNPNPPAADSLRIVGNDGKGNQTLIDPATGASTPVPAAGALASHLTLTVTVSWGRRTDVYPGLELNPAHPRSIANILQAADPNDEACLVWLDIPGSPAAGPGPAPVSDQLTPLLTALLTLSQPKYLTGGTEGAALSPDAIKGEKADPDNVNKAATGLEALLEVEDIAIVASPNAIGFSTEAERKTAVDDLIAHCEAPHAYRIGIIDPPANASLSEVRTFRSQFDSTYAALYYPWVEIVDPTVRVDPSAAPARLDLPPSGFTAGIYARNDVQRGVHKAPANEVILGITKFVQNVTYDRQAVLNPEGINALRFFEGRANRVWGARTISSDPEWKYVNVRRLFVYLEHSIDKSTQWAVFEPNNERLWASIRQSIEDFLLVVWRTGALMGTKPEEAFFVRCDRTTMAQNDLDNGRLICLIGVAPTYPAEFVIFRIGQWTADAQQA
ncbi:phage tail sheath subtilisin-like domain-containing protein [Paenarthrobacter sp. PH39-S1]|uniref:phage tail sheath family protein n=1 Tax=Paenarthrobacter sp. PH39-S1 TaxID=3046204 RepID=UPI0024BB4339|nr:phage tail sheath subtilisin-like domain-containing protein [Paenarthrobacter sp. PH39-S1]MDJ0355304.1 phage tail sheath subtilisin-like domain-containing protein [Paenarthrobacter sp. PH39-S1]